MKRKHLMLILLLAATTLLLGGCGVPREGVDVATTAPEGLWQTLAVWPLANALIWLNDTIAGLSIPYSWGFAIILFTVIIKLVTFPLTMTQIRGMQAQRELQPKLQELQKKYGKDREKLAQEQMKMYQEAGVNPLSGCLPLLIQMPVLFGLYSALVALGPRLNNAHFFWIPDLGYPHYTDGMNWIPQLFNEGSYAVLAGYLVLPALLMVSQVYMQKYMTPTPTTGSNDSQAKMMTQMTTIMTLMFGFFTLQVPAGLTLYWVTSNLLQMAQQMVVMRINPVTAPAPAPVKVSPSGSTSGSTTSTPIANGAKEGSNGVDGADGDTLRKSSRRQRKKR